MCLCDAWENRRRTVKTPIGEDLTAETMMSEMLESNESMGGMQKIHNVRDEKYGGRTKREGAMAKSNNNNN